MVSLRLIPREHASRRPGRDLWKNREIWNLPPWSNSLGKLESAAQAGSYCDSHMWRQHILAVWIWVLCLGLVVITLFISCGQISFPPPAHLTLMKLQCAGFVAYACYN